ncbi:chromatin modification-like protein eaf3 [Blastomyces dermatitidis ER-3]|uniref:Chromatin modification-related protein EAF3 n=3 Tax=Blastomyces TaxID=229219 RepID=A0A179UHE2_BLAGS|nr:chromatin modification-like protein eaf3 [Blastomyces gilchristii SLH14081]XP_045282464.1 chromatin modification-like protein eaf3 [Blastomyces dermatitidis ER-3]EGE79285.2 chromatin modification-like protein eaf3 [Blastomyces dermatitidis ATCC 18188]EQL35707.1 chromatin modification-like protein eaf3 [Blastomyces dermatitidis ATCC 26199]OAT02737.1 chromatin modification-like protein eaf3 [Blastomyces dermatitidis ER-3]OAT07465.1 chromatin modification-like protein eaf3 [Blastomyces gilchri
MAPANHPIYHKDEKVFCFHHEILYEAKILEVRLTDPDDRKSPYEYRVHYKGWKNTWDDWVLQDRLRKATEENRELAATLRRDVEASMRQRTKQSSAKRRRGSDMSSNRNSEERHSSTPARGTKRSRDAEIEKVCSPSLPFMLLKRYCFDFAVKVTHIIFSEEHFNARPSIRIVMPDTLKALLVDDWENITKNMQLVPLPAKVPVNKILDTYFEEEKVKRTSQAQVDVLEEVLSGVREYFDKCLGRLLLYSFEREQYHILQKKWESAAEGFVDKGPCDVYGAEHLARLFASLPELLAQTNLGQESTNRLREELSKLAIWLSRNSEKMFATKYKSPGNEYIDKAKGISNPDAPGTATSRLF